MTTPPMIPDLAVCEYCDTVHKRAPLHRRGKARCATCDAPLYRGDPDLGAMLAVTLTAIAGFSSRTGSRSSR